MSVGSFISSSRPKSLDLFLPVFNPAGKPAMSILRHQHQVSSGQADMVVSRGPLVLIGSLTTWTRPLPLFKFSFLVSTGAMGSIGSTISER